MAALLIALRRFHFSAAHQLSSAGLESRLHGHNFSAWVGVTAPVRPDTGLILADADWQTIASVFARYDSRHLNAQLGQVEPTLPNLTRALWEAVRVVLPAPVQLASIELMEEGGATVHATSTEMRVIESTEFAAAHRTHAPRLSAAENLALYGKCNNPQGHGHNYRVEVRLPFGASLPPGVWEEFDHKNLSADIPELRGHNVVTETLAELVSRRVPTAHSVRVWEMSDFFAEYQPQAQSRPYRLGRRWRFCAAHQVRRPARSAEDNRRLYGKCFSPEPHGHTYTVEVTLAGALDPLTETAYDLARLDRMGHVILSELDYTNLDSDLAAFHDRPSTGENLAAHLGARFEAQLGPALVAARVAETPDRHYSATVQ